VRSKEDWAKTDEISEDCEGYREGNYRSIEKEITTKISDV